MKFHLSNILPSSAWPTGRRPATTRTSIVCSSPSSPTRASPPRRREPSRHGTSTDVSPSRQRKVERRPCCTRSPDPHTISAPPPTSGPRRGEGVLPAQNDAGQPSSNGRPDRRPCRRASQGRRPRGSALPVPALLGNVYSYVRSIVHDDHEAEDITQHVFAKLMTVVGKYEQRGVPFSGWILRLAHNVAIDHLRARRAMPAEEVFGSDERTDEWSSTGPLPAGRARGPARGAAQGRRPPPRRRADPQRDRHADGRSEGSIHGLHHRGRRALQEELVHMEAAPVTARPRRPSGLMRAGRTVAGRPPRGPGWRIARAAPWRSPRAISSRRAASRRPWPRTTSRSSCRPRSTRSQPALAER